ncbi:MAG: AmmeMemoRadiSam system protein B [Phycisphaerae bacterium]|jgi:AmmeMemoRadiSam system protein B
MMIREPVVAGQFYPSRAGRCRTELVRLLDENPVKFEPQTRILGGLLPHAGWSCSGGVAAKVFQVLAAATSPEVVVLFGGVHRHIGTKASLFGTGRWETPIGVVAIDDRLTERILGHTNLITDDPYAHETEHSLEVQMPFVKHLFPDAKIAPIMVPPVETADEVGEAVARTLKAYDYDAVIIGTTDLTHYGPDYGFTPQGVGPNANAWAKVENDRRFVDLLCAVDSGDLVAEAKEHKNACSSGAAAATVSAVAQLGATEGVLLDHTTSAEVLPGDHDNSVGYAGIVYV